MNITVFLTGRENTLIKQSIRWLADRHRLTELRLLVIPDRCDYLQHLSSLTAFIHALGNVPVRINAFHAHGVYGEAARWRSAAPEDIECWRRPRKAADHGDPPDPLSIA